MEYLIEYGMFLAKALTVVVAMVFVIAAVAAAGSRVRGGRQPRIKVHRLNDHVDDLRDALRASVLDKAHFKQLAKAERAERKKAAKAAKAAEKAAKKQAARNDSSQGDSEQGSSGRGSEAQGSDAEKRIFVLRFDGDIAARDVDSLREEITAVLAIARQSDEVLLCLESPGGMVHAYGLASSQLTRIRKQKIPLTICVDKVAASGGYMMACLADRLVAAPFAVIGSIGVLVQMPNFHRALQRKEIDYEIITAGEYKRTLSAFGKITDKARDKVQEDVDVIHDVFKNWVREHRPGVEVDRIATGETWLGMQAQELGLVDELATSDECIVAACAEHKVYEVEYVIPVPAYEKLAKVASLAVDRLLLKWSSIPPKSKMQ